MAEKSIDDMVNNEHIAGKLDLNRAVQGGMRINSEYNSKIKYGLLILGTAAVLAFAAKYVANNLSDGYFSKSSYDKNFRDTPKKSNANTASDSAYFRKN
jgi:hypothetical protein